MDPVLRGRPLERRVRTQMLDVMPTSLEQANAFVGMLHRHHKPVQGHKFSLAVADVERKVRGVVIVGRPVSRHLDDGWTLEVNRCCTDGARNACSMLYGAAWRAAKALGYKRMITYTLPEEGGASMRAAGWRLVRTADTQANWKRDGREYDEKKYIFGAKTLWEATVGVPALPPPQVPVQELVHGQAGFEF